MATLAGTFGLCARCARTLAPRAQPSGVVRAFTTSSARQEDLQQQPPAEAQPPAIEPALVGSRRRQAALKSTGNVPFTQLPYQCFQEALSFLREDRAEKVVQIEEQRRRIARLEQSLLNADNANSRAVLRSLNSSKEHLEYLKVQADINDPTVKRRFEDGLGNMNKPVYRHLARRKWESYERKIVLQRITQMGVVPDVLPPGAVRPTMQLRVSFGGKRVAHGMVVPSTTSERAPTLHVQSFEAGEKLVSVAVVDSDVPNTETDSFSHRLHALLTNVTLTPTTNTIKLSLPADDPTQVVPWLPPTAQNGAPWHRLSVWVLEHHEGQRIDVQSLKEKYTRENFTLRSLQSRHHVKPIGVSMFRTKWDEGMREVMERHGIEGADVVWKKKAFEPMPYKKKDGRRFR